LIVEQLEQFIGRRRRRGRGYSYAYIVLPACQVQVLIWASDASSTRERAHGDKFLDCK
jgi:hypothetical protein